jgi:hypothetical protein
MEGKITRCIKRAKRTLTFWEWVSALHRYWGNSERNPTKIIHPTHRTPEERKLLYQKRAKRRAKKKRHKKKAT